MKKFVLCIACLFFIGGQLYAREIIDLLPGHPGELFCWTESITKPRSLKIHFIMVDLTSKDLEVIAIPGDDPDGNGPAESELTAPITLFNKFNALAAVNANAFDSFNKDDRSHPGWYEGQPVDISGMVVSQGKTISRSDVRRVSFWLDKDQRPHIDRIVSGGSATEAVSDWFSPLIVNSQIVPDSSDPEVHPRTALGFDDSGEWLLLVVVEGRQPGYSEGVTLHELATILETRGCTQAINMDGGGSSIMLIRDPENMVRTVNQPSDGNPRPVPVMLGVRRR